MEFLPQSYTIDKLLKWIDDGKLALPDFQRDFVWSPKKVADLVDSVSRGWPVGALLLLDGPQDFEARPVEGADELLKPPSVYVLDGQQRLTGLYHAISDVSDTVYYVKFAELIEGGEFLAWEKRDRFETQYPTAESRAADSIAQVPEVYSFTRFMEWQRYLSPEDSSRFADARERLIPGLHAQVYKVAAISLDEGIELEALARIFETINRTGVRLNAFDLMVAVLYPHGFYLRDEWEHALAQHDELNNFSVDGLEILKLITLWERRDELQKKNSSKLKGVKQGDILNTPAKRVQTKWEDAVLAYVASLEYLVSEFGVSNTELVPSSAMNLALAYMLDDGRTGEELREWYWESVCLQSYAHGANTRVVRDVDRFFSERDKSFSEPDPKIFDEQVLRNQTLVRAIGGLLVKGGALDPLSERPLEELDSVVFRSVVDLADGRSRASRESKIVDQLFMSERTRKQLTSRTKKGENIMGIVSNEAMLTQGFSPTARKPSTWSRGRAEILVDRVRKEIGSKDE